MTQQKLTPRERAILKAIQESKNVRPTRTVIHSKVNAKSAAFVTEAAISKCLTRMSKKGLVAQSSNTIRCPKDGRPKNYWFQKAQRLESSETRTPGGKKPQEKKSVNKKKVLSIRQTAVMKFLSNLTETIFTRQTVDESYDAAMELKESIEKKLKNPFLSKRRRSQLERQANAVVNCASYVNAVELYLNPTGESDEGQTGEKKG